MRGARLIAFILLAMTVAGSLIQDAGAETRTLTTTVIVTVRPAIPDMQSAPKSAQDVLTTALSQSQNQRFVRLESPSQSGLEASRYTMMEKL